MTVPGFNADSLNCTSLIIGDPDTYDRAWRTAEELYAQLATNPAAVEQYGRDALDKLNKLVASLLSDAELSKWDAPTEPTAELEWLDSKRDAYSKYLKECAEAETLMVFTIAVMELVSGYAPVIPPANIAQHLSELAERIRQYKIRLIISHHCKPQVEGLRSQTVRLISQAELLLLQRAVSDAQVRDYLLERQLRITRQE